MANSEELESKLRNPKIRNLLQLYNTLEIKEIYEHLSQYFKELHELEALDFIITDPFRSDPAEALEKFKSIFQEIDNADIDPSKSKLVEILRVNLSLLQELFPAFMEYHLSLANAISDLASSKKTKPEEIIYNQLYLDDAKRKVFPQRKDYEEYYKMNLTISLEVLNRLRTSISKYEGETHNGDEISELEKLFPAPDLIKKLNGAYWGYIEKEGNRIYGK